MISPVGAFSDITDVDGIEQTPKPNKKEYTTVISDISTQGSPHAHSNEKQTFHDRKGELHKNKFDLLRRN